MATTFCQDFQAMPTLGVETVREFDAVKEPSLTLRVSVSHPLTRRVSEGSAGDTPRNFRTVSRRVSSPATSEAGGRVSRQRAGGPPRPRKLSELFTRPWKLGLSALRDRR